MKVISKQDMNEANHLLLQISAGKWDMNRVKALLARVAQDPPSAKADRMKRIAEMDSKIK
jgi:hypothetical protein